MVDWLFVAEFEMPDIEFVRQLDTGEQYLPARLEIRGGVVDVVELGDVSAQAGDCW